MTLNIEVATNYAKSIIRTIAKHFSYRNFLFGTAFALVLFLKCILFNRQLIPDGFGIHTMSRLMLINLCFSGIIASFVCLSRRMWWTVATAFILDIWLIGNNLYLCTYDDLLNSWCLQNISNMTGVWSSIIPFFKSTDLLYPLSSIVWTLVVILLRNSRFERGILGFTVGILLSLWCFKMTYNDIRYYDGITNPFAKYYKEVSMGRKWYCMNFSPIAHLMNEIRNLISNKISDGELPGVSEEELLPFLNDINTATNSNRNLILVLFESLEHWTINSTVDNNEITPQLNKLINSRNTLYFSHCKPQVRQGKSSDAQLIICTGLLPVKDGAVCMRFPNNVFPSIVEAAQPQHSKILIPTPSSAWNQGGMTKAYHFDSLFAETISDKEMAHIVSNEIDNMKQPFNIMVTTMASHSPFTTYCDSSSLSLGDNFPKDLKRYVQSVNYTDACLGAIIGKIQSDSSLANNTTLVITGDHTIFTDDDRAEYSNILDIEMQGFVPLIIYDNQLQQSRCDSAIYQADIYPTILHLLDCKNYYWKGIGHDLLDSTNCINENALEISDKLIRSNYFSRIKRK